MTSERPPLMRRLARDPVARFVVLGVAIFVAHSFLSRGHEERHPIVVTTRIEAGLVADYRQRFGHQPSPGERERLVTEWVRQEALVREAEALDLDRDDPIVRRRLAEKTELMLRSQANIAPPTDAEIRAWMEDNPEQVARDSRTSFVHAFASRDIRPSSAQADAARWVAALGAANPPDPAGQARAFGDAFALGPDITRMTTGDIVARFGEAFSTELAACEVGRPCGPIGSRYGFHAVVVTAREASGTLAFSAAKPIAERAILREREDASLARSIEALVMRDGVVRAGVRARP